MNTDLFQTTGGKRAAKVKNHAGGKAYDPGAEHGLAQMAMTCTLADSYYTKAPQQLQEVISLADQCSPEYIGKLAVYAREVGQMKDLPALLVAYLASKYENDILDSVFARVIDNGRMVRNFVQIIRSGVLGRKGLGSQPKRLLRQWFAAQGAEGVYRNSTGSAPSMADVIKLARPIPYTPEERDMYRYLIGKGEACGAAWQLKKWAAGEGEMPRLPFEFLAGAAKTQQHWEDIAMGLSWNATLKNLNTFARHGVSSKAWEAIHTRLTQTPPKHVFPYSIMTAYRYIDSNIDIPMSVKLAVQDALDASLANVPRVEGSLAVLVDVSGSMQSPVTGYRGSATGATRCVDVAALIASVFLHKNPETTVIPFDTRAYTMDPPLNPRDSVITNAGRIHCPGGGTDVSCGLRALNYMGKAPDLVVMVSDNESWFSNRLHNSITAAQREWNTMVGKNKNARLVCLDVQANPTVQVQTSKRVLNLGGFSDAIFRLVSEFSRGGLDTGAWVERTKCLDL